MLQYVCKGLNSQKRKRLIKEMKLYLKALMLENVCEGLNARNFI